MFRRISYIIALQFTVFVFLLLVINGAIFLVVDLSNARHQSRQRVTDLAHSIVLQMESDTDVVPAILSPPPGVRSPPPPGRFPPMRDRLRILDANGVTLEGGSLFTEIPFTPAEGISQITLHEEEYTMVTEAIRRNGTINGYVQVVGLERFQQRELPMRILLYLLVSAAISALTFFVGLFFARRSLKPAEQMMERLEQFTQDASHELKTPLAALSSSLDLALKTEKYREGILSAKDDLKQVAVLVERLLELARLDKFVRADTPVDLTALIAASAERFGSMAKEKDIVIDHNLHPGVTVQGDPVLIRQVVENLLSNAIKFSKPSGGTIHMRLASKSFSIEDEGVGMAAAELPNIFNRFYQAEPSRAKGGFGLGLALVKRIVELHGWTVDARSVQGKGSTFTVYFTAQGHASRS